MLGANDRDSSLAEAVSHYFEKDNLIMTNANILISGGIVKGRNINTIDNKDSKELKLIYNTLLKEKGIGQETALTLICSMQELGKTERKQIASISGLAPTPKESGTTTGHRYLQGGRRDIKSAMYLCIMNMIRFDKNIKDKINEFVSKGKNKKTAICALARKKITILKAIVKKQLLLNGFA
jgi:transposase